MDAFDELEKTLAEWHRQERLLAIVEGCLLGVLLLCVAAIWVYAV